MSKETLLLTTADNHVVAIALNYGNEAEKQRKMLQYQQLCEQITYKEFFDKYNNFAASLQCGSALEKEFLTAVDAKNTEFLAKEIAHYDFMKNPAGYKNGLKENNYPPHIASAANTLHFDNRIDDAEIPPLIKNLGYKIEPQDNVYDVYYDSAKQEYTIKDFEPRRASVNVGEKRVSFVRNHFKFSPSDYSTLMQLIARAERARQINPRRRIAEIFPDPKERSLYKVYSDEHIKVAKQLLMLKHELTHVKNTVLQTGYCLKNGAKRLSVEDYYRLQVEDERSAYLSQVFNAVNAYLKKGNPKDFSMFDGESSQLLLAMRNMPESKRFEYVQNPKNLLDSAFASFEKNHRRSYDKKQFLRNMKLEIQLVPLSAAEDTDRTEFFKRRSLLYRFQLYNPQTGAYEVKNLTPLIDKSQEVELTPENISNIIEPCRHDLSRRLAEFNRDKSRGLVNPDLVDEAKALMRGNLHKNRLINNINGMEISELAEAEKQPAGPQRPNAAPQKPCSWNKELKKYWSKLDGYKEIVDTEQEYSFSVKQNKIRYTAKDKVQVAKDAEYDMYVKLLQEPSNKNKPVIFKDTLTKEQALKLYVACVNNNRQMKGAVPKDFSALQKLRDIPADDLQKCQQTIQQGNRQNPLLQRQLAARSGR